MESKHIGHNFYLVTKETDGGAEAWIAVNNETTDGFVVPHPNWRAHGEDIKRVREALRGVVELLRAAVRKRRFEKGPETAEQFAEKRGIREEMKRARDLIDEIFEEISSVGTALRQGSPHIRFYVRVRNNSDDIIEQHEEWRERIHEEFDAKAYNELSVFPVPVK